MSHSSNRREEDQGWRILAYLLPDQERKGSGHHWRLHWVHETLRQERQRHHGFRRAPTHPHGFGYLPGINQLLNLNRRNIWVYQNFSFTIQQANASKRRKSMTSWLPAATPRMRMAWSPTNVSYSHSSVFHIDLHNDILHFKFEI